VTRWAVTLAAMAGVLCAGVVAQSKWSDALPRPVYRTLERVAVDDPWFEVYRVAPGVTAIYEPGHFEEALSYLIEGRERAMLFDSGMGIGRIKPVVDRLTALEVLVVNSHSHFDHTGGDGAFARVAVLDSEYARERLLRGVPDLSRQISEESIARPLPAGFDAARYRREPIRPTRFLFDGEIIDLGGRRLEVLATPGHTPDSLCLLDRANRMLFTGDTFYPATLYAHSADANLGDYVKSAARLGALASAVDVICPGHNEARVEGAALTKFAHAFRMIAEGRAPSRPEREGIVRYEVDGIAVLARTGAGK
jgi:glyoxylase-like metal-dependent hydrolase (beta-lactamase superfamily II)